MGPVHSSTSPNLLLFCGLHRWVQPLAAPNSQLIGAGKLHIWRPKLFPGAVTSYDLKPAVTAVLSCVSLGMISTCNVSSIFYRLVSSNSTTIGSIDEVMPSYSQKRTTSIFTSRRYVATAAHPVDLVRSSPGHQYARWWWLPGAGLREKGGKFDIHYIHYIHILFEFYRILIFLILFWSYRTLFYAYQTSSMFVFIPWCFSWLHLLQLPRPRWQTSKTSTWRPSAPKRHWRSDVDIVTSREEMTQHNNEHPNIP